MIKLLKKATVQLVLSLIILLAECAFSSIMQKYHPPIPEPSKKEATNNIYIISGGSVTILNK